MNFEADADLIVTLNVSTMYVGVETLRDLEDDLEKVRSFGGPFGRELRLGQQVKLARETLLEKWPDFENNRRAAVAATRARSAA